MIFTHLMLMSSLQTKQNPASKNKTGLMPALFSSAPKNRFLLIGIVVLAVLMLAVALFDWRSSRAELLASVQGEAETLVETLNRSGEIAVLASMELEKQLLQRLVATARLAAQVERRSPLDREHIERLASNNEVSTVAVIDGKGRAVAATGMKDEADPLPAEMIEDLSPVLDGEYRWISLGVREYPTSARKSYFVAHERLSGPGAVLVGVDSDTLVSVRKRTGIGRLLRSIGENPDIEYVLLQDDDGIMSASSAVTEVAPIEADPFLDSAYASGKMMTRIIDHEGEMALEVVKRLELPNGETALTRLALSLANIRKIQQRAMLRIIFIAAGVFVAGVFLLGFLLTRERFALLREEHRKVTDSTAVVLDNIADAVVAVDRRGIVTVFNKAAECLLNKRASEAMGKPCSEICAGDPFLLLQTLKEGPIEYKEEENDLPDGTRATLGVGTSVIHDADGFPETAISVAKDLTEQRRTREKLQRNERLTALGGMAGGIAHEIRNPLNAIGVIAQRFRSEFEPREDAEEFRKLADTVRDEVRRLNDIITQFLAFARPSRIEPVVTDLHELMRGALDVMDSEARAAGVSIELLTSTPASVSADRHRMRQALLNLLRNSLEAMPDGGALTCEVTAAAGAAVLKIKDTGIGIKPEDLPHLFDPYYTTKPSGSGLGLSIAHQIISEHDGVIEAGNGKGGGAVFTITLPLRGDEIPGASPQAAFAPPLSEGNRK